MVRTVRLPVRSSNYNVFRTAPDSGRLAPRRVEGRGLQRFQIGGQRGPLRALRAELAGLAAASLLAPLVAGTAERGVVVLREAELRAARTERHFLKAFSFRKSNTSRTSLGFTRKRVPLPS